MSRHIRTLSAVIALVGIIALTAAPALAKEGAEAKLDTAIPRDAEPGSTIDVGWSVFSTFEDVPTGSRSTVRRSTSGSWHPTAKRRPRSPVPSKPSGSGHYTASIEVPAGGIGEVVVGMVGEACDGGWRLRAIRPHLPADRPTRPS